MQLAATILIIALTMYFLVREVDVRLVLFASGLALALLARKPLTIFDVFLTEMGNGKTIGPICTAMGYAFVLRATGCDREMVRILLAPVRRAKWLLIPGGCIVGFVTNAAITSQTAVAAAVGPILVPLMLAAGYSPLMAAATLVVGCSGGGSLYNPGDADLVAIQEASKAPMKLALAAMLWPLVWGFLASVVVLIFLSRRRAGEEGPTQPPPEAAVEGPPQRWKALLPPLPVLMIFAMLPGWLFSSLPPPFEKGLPVSHAMLISTGIVLLACHRDVSKTAKTFFEGMGYAYGNIISIVVTASCFIAGLTEMGLTEKLVRLVSGTGLGGKLAAGFFPGILGVISGSGIGPSVAFSKAVLPSVSATNLPAALDLGVTSAIAANFGRTMSPVAAVVIFCGTLVGVPALGIVKRTALPMIIGISVAMIVVYLRSR